MGRYLVSTDTGGTFVDAVIWDLAKGSYFVGKAPTTPDDASRGIVAAVVSAAQIAGLDPAEIFRDVELVCNGTTVTTNAMIERRGAKTGLLVTAGFEDTLAIANVTGRTAGLDESELLDYRHAEGPQPIVPKALVRGIVERVDARGNVLVPLQFASAERALQELVDEGIEALAICLLWSFRRPEHEQWLRARATALFPHLFVVASSDLIPVLREYERANTTAINASLGPLFHRYNKGLRSRFAEEGCDSDALIMHSLGGLSSVDDIARTPIVTLFSGPVGGVVAGKNLGTMIGQRNVITTDMGGTSFDVGLILDGEPLTTRTTVIERQIVAIPTVDIVTVGAGGGSVSWINDMGLLRVGPHSQGSVPGPACYERGGELATVTDADVVLGYIDSEHFLGGRMRISRDAAAEAIRKTIAEPLGLSIEEAAAGIYRIVNARMADLIRRVTVERGHDPREFVLAAFGGCGPTHCTAYAPDIGVTQVVVPETASVFSALGISQSDIKHFWVRAFSQTLRHADGRIEAAALDELNVTLSALHQQARAQFEKNGFAPEDCRAVPYAELRYRNQVHELLVPLPSNFPLMASDLSEVVRRFETLYEQRYGSGASAAHARIEWVNLRLDVAAPTKVKAALAPIPLVAASPREALIGEKPVYDLIGRRYRLTLVYSAEKLRPGHVVDGPGLVLAYGMTIPLHDRQRLTVDEHRNFLISFAGEAGFLDVGAAAEAKEASAHGAY